MKKKNLAVGALALVGVLALSGCASDAIEALVKERDELKFDYAKKGRALARMGQRYTEAEADRQATIRERDELAAVIYGAQVEADYLTVHGVLGSGARVKRILSTAPADALREHDAALIESLADDMEGGFNRETLNLERRQIKRWLRERARQVREGQ